MSHRCFSPHRLTEERERAGLSRQQLATATSRSWFTVYAWERGTAHPKVSALAAIADALDCPIDDLFVEVE